MAGHPAVRVDDDLAAGQARVTHRAAGDEAAGRVDVHDRVRRPSSRGIEGRITYSTMSRPEPLGADVGIVLGGHDDRPNALRNAMLVLDGHLGLAVGAEERQLARLADLGEAAGHPVGEGDREGHELGRLAAGEAEHHPLVAGAELVVGGVLADLEGGVDAHRDVGRLLLDRHQGPAGQVVEAVLGLRVADLPDGLPDDRRDVDVLGVGRDLAEDDARGRSSSPPRTRPVRSDRAG